MSLNYIGLLRNDGRYGFNRFNGRGDGCGHIDGVLHVVGGDTAAEVGRAGVVAGAWERVCGEVGVVRLLPELVAVVGGGGCGPGGDGGMVGCGGAVLFDDRWTLFVGIECRRKGQRLAAPNAATH